jgi:hypothetical protein
VTEREAAIMKAARDAQRREDADTLELSARVLDKRGHKKTAAVLLAAATSIRERES